MATKQQLYDALQELQAENHQLRLENEAFRSALMKMYTQTRLVLGIEAAAAAREAEKQKLKGA